MRTIAILAALWCSQAAAYLGSFDPQPLRNSAAITVIDTQVPGAVCLAEANALRAEIEALKAPKPIVRVPTAALLIVIERRGLTLQLDAIRAALPEQQQREFELYLKMPYTRRDHPLVAMVQQAFGWTDGEVDALFAEADAV